METVLVVDDESDVLKIAAEILIEGGYRVIEADSPGAALDALRHEPGVGLLFTDVVMPGMNGFELARRAKALRPDLRVLFTSGFVRDVPGSGFSAGHDRLLKKPWRAQQLEDEVRAALAH